MLQGRLPIILLVIGGLAFYWFSNQKEGLSGRKQMITMGVEQEVALGDQSYMQILSSEPVLCGGNATSCGTDERQVVEVIETVGERIARAAIEWEAEGAPVLGLGKTRGEIPKWGTLADKFYISGKEVERLSTNHFIVKDATLTTCEGVLPAWKIEAKTTDIVKGSKYPASVSSRLSPSFEHNNSFDSVFFL